MLSTIALTGFKTIPKRGNLFISPSNAICSHSKGVLIVPKITLPKDLKIFKKLSQLGLVIKLIKLLKVSTIPTTIGFITLRIEAKRGNFSTNLPVTLS